MRASVIRLIAAVAAPLVVAGLLSAWLIADQHQRAALQTDEAVRAMVAGAVGPVRTALRDQVAAAIAGTVAGDRVVPTADVGTGRLSATTAAIVRDTGAATLDDTLRTPSIVAPVYRPGTAPANTAERRADIVGYRIVPLALHSVLASLAPLTGGLLVRGPHRVITEVNGTPPDDARRFGVDMQLSLSPGWVVSGWRPAPPVPGITWFWVLAVVALLGALAAAFGYLVHRNEQFARRARQLERDRALVTGLAPVLQASLDMGEVLPPVTAHLADGLRLAGLSLSTPTPDGEHQIFAWGTPPDPAVQPSVLIPERIEPGGTHALSVARGGRVLGVLRVVSGEPLTRQDLGALAAAAELFGSTLANAEAYARQQELVERMRSVDELKTVFLATASHELRTPVTAIVGFSTLLLGQWDDLDPTIGRGLMERVLANGRRLDNLIEQLLDFSRLERGLPRAGEELLDLGTCVGRVLTEQPELAGEHQLRPVLGNGCLVRGSTAAVERIVTNLVGNAAKYSPAGTTITVTVRTDADRVLLLVDDQGPGVAPDDRTKVFTRFYRGRPDTVRSTKGVGIGLAIVSEYAATMSGEVSVTSAPGGGARFVVSVPAVRTLARTVAEGDADVAPA